MIVFVFVVMLGFFVRDFVCDCVIVEVECSVESIVCFFVVVGVVD